MSSLLFAVSSSLLGLTVRGPLRAPAHLSLIHI